MEHRSGKHRQHAQAPDLGELDAIVITIFDSIDKVGADRGCGSAREDRRGQQAEGRQAVERREPPRAAASQPAGAAGEVRPFEPTSPSSDLLAPTSGTRELDSEDVNGDSSFLLNGEEEEFVERTVAWLTSRPNPDILLNRIWSRLIELTEEEEANLPSHDDQRETSGRSGGQEEA